MKPISLSLRDFAIPSPRTGGIETGPGHRQSAAEGRELHLRIQRRRGKADSLYRSEVPVSCSFERGGFVFTVDGRMDGIFMRDTPLIEEIKTGFTVRDLANSLSHNPLDHPYGLQLLSYGYFYWREHRILPQLSFHLVSFRSGEAGDVPISLDLPAYEGWLETRLDELVVEARLAEERAARRRKVAAAFPFPFEHPRPGQRELMQTIEEGMGVQRPLLLQAPTGLGKTAGVLYPVLQEALGRGQRVIYVTPKNSQHSVAEETVARFRSAGARVKSLSITAKGKICFMEEPFCTPEYCEFARDYYEKLRQHDILATMRRKRKLTARIFRKIGETCRVCPFELQLECAEEADVVICDYNYVFAPRSALGRLGSVGLDQAGKPNLVIDEAHNLPSRAMDYYSPGLSRAMLEQVGRDIQALPGQQDEEEGILKRCLAALLSCRTRAGSAPARIDPPHQLFRELEEELRDLVSRHLETAANPQQRNPLVRLAFLWSDFTSAVERAADPEREEFFATFDPVQEGGTLKVTCCDASAMLAGCYDSYRQVVGFSATLKPFEHYAGLSGFDPQGVRTAEFGSPFPAERRKIIIIPQVSTTYASRGRNYGRIAEAVHRIAELRRGNYFVFVPSFLFLKSLMAAFAPPEGFTVLSQEPGMKAARLEEIVERLRTPEGASIVFAVQGGSFAEGMDYVGEMVIGAFVVGAPLPNYELERELMRNYYQKRYGDGFAHAYTIPAMAKAVQAAGRVIRSETDRGLIVLMDGRFLEPRYSRSMPADWFKEHPAELVSEGILAEVAEFWATGGVTG